MEKIKITVDGKEMLGEVGETILTIAARNGVEIPNLCYNKNLKLYGACGVCVVEAEYLMATGQLDNPAVLTIAETKSTIAVELLVQLRNKALDAYSELNRISL